MTKGAAPAPRTGTASQDRRVRERSELVELREQVEAALGGRVGAWWDGVVALRTGPPTVENLVKALEKLRGAPPLVAVNGPDVRTSSLTAERFVERALARGIRTKDELLSVVGGFAEPEEITTALAALCARGNDAAIAVSRNEKSSRGG